ncbi:hypothetical protein [Luteimonas suaedae]|uniref:hypothetical protein n=1 Tax=Luteimonas suaedae TaxID=2605430 RepID=UPI0011EC18FD|nr:hypothetical protein [Luteimonas suaedae]
MPGMKSRCRPARASACRAGRQSAAPSPGKPDMHSQLLRRMAFSTILLAATAPPAFAQAADPSQCARIDDVDVPHEVRIDPDQVVFGARDAAVAVRADAIVFDGRQVAQADPAYYADLRRFLGEADRTAREIKPLAALFRGRGAEVAEAATRMCGAILALAESTGRVEATVPGFESPVRIRLK